MVGDETALLLFALGSAGGHTAIQGRTTHTERSKCAFEKPWLDTPENVTVVDVALPKRYLQQCRY